MKLIGIDCQIPSNQIFNEDVIELVKFYSSGYYNDLNKLESIIRKYLNLTGIQTRFWRLPAEKPIDLVIHSVENAIKMAGINKSDIDYVIYSSIDRGFVEPANASIISKALGFQNVRSFDIVDACMGWASSVQIANALFKSDSSINSLLIINSEFPMDKRGSVIPNNFKIRDKNDLKWKSASFTLGEGASACIFQNVQNGDFKFEIIENPQNAELCTIPLANFEKYLTSEGNVFQELQFYADSHYLLENGLEQAIQVLLRLLKRLNYTPNIIFPHSVSNKIIQEASRLAEINTQVYSTFTQLGNLATVSIPSAIKKAILNNVIKRDEKGIAWVASVGMKFSAFEVQL